MDLASLGKSPVHADMPAGSDIRYDPGFEELQAEVDKLSSPLASGALDWSKVERLASEILAVKSKDLLVASYLAVALIYTRKFEGFAIGLRVYIDLLERYWDNLYPPKARMRGRTGAIDWWLEKSEAALAQIPQTPLPAEKLAPVRECLEKIGKFFDENLEEPVSLRPLIGFVDSLVEPPTKEAGPAPPSQASASLTATSPPGTEPGKPAGPDRSEAFPEIASSEDAWKVIDAGLRKLWEAAGYLRKEDPSNPQSYRVARIAAWSAIHSAPPAADGRTRIAPPAAHIKTPLEDLRSKGNHEALLQAIESIFPQWIFWLDLNRWTAEALSRLGEKYHGAHEAVCRETAFLIYRIPAVEELSFSDGTPFADPETRQWLKKTAIGTGAVEEETDLQIEAGPVQGDADEFAAAVDKAKALIREGRLPEAIDPLQQRLRGSFSRKETVQWRMALSRLLLGADHARLALPHLEQILADIDDFRLEEYDPLFALEGLKLAWRGFDSQMDKSSKERAAQTLLRIGKIDLTEVLRMGKGK
jgi:type VI secretion system protein VasJ